MRLAVLTGILFSALSFPLSLWAAPSSHTIDGTYQTLQPERGKNGQPTQEILMQLTQLNGQQVLVTAGCHPGCTLIIYSYQVEQSKTLNKDIFFSKAGLYIIRVNDNAMVSVIPDAQLGMKEWKTLRFVNVYAKKGTPLPLDLAGATEFAYEQSKAIMNTGTLSAMSHGSGNYHIAAPIKVLGKSHQAATIQFQDGKDKSIGIQACDACPSDDYSYLADESGLTGTATYGNGQGNIVFDVNDGVLIWAGFKRGFGKKEWESDNHFNVYAKDIGYIRSVRSDKSVQANIDKLIKSHATLVKSEMDQRAATAQAAKVAALELPNKGLSDAKLETEATQAAKNWANSWGWKETIAYAYLTSPDWGIKHHPLTGLVTGRHIRGIIVMRRPDGMCSFHYGSFGQQYDGSQFTTTYMVGLTPGQIQLSCEKI